MMRRVLAILVVTAAVVGGVFYFVNRRASPPIAGLAPVSDSPFDEKGILRAVPRRAWYSSDGSRLVVVTGSGLSIAKRGSLVPVTESGSRVVDAAWFSGSATLLVAEGPIPTGQLAVVGTDGSIKGSVMLDPSVGFGTGNGIAVARGNRVAIATAVDRPTLAAAEVHNLVSIDLATGLTRTLTPADASDESGPYVVDEATVAFTAGSRTDRPTARLLDLPSGTTRSFTTGRVVGVLRGGDWVAVLRGRDLLAVRVPELDAGEPPDEHRLARLPASASLLAVHPTGAQAVIVETVTTDGQPAARTRAMTLTPPKPDDN